MKVISNFSSNFHSIPSGFTNVTCRWICLQLGVLLSSLSLLAIFRQDMHFNIACTACNTCPVSCVLMLPFIIWYLNTISLIALVSRGFSDIHIEFTASLLILQMTQIAKILNSHMDSLQWVDQNAGKLAPPLAVAILPSFFTTSLLWQISSPSFWYQSILRMTSVFLGSRRSYQLHVIDYWGYHCKKTCEQLWAGRSILLRALHSWPYFKPECNIIHIFIKTNSGIPS